MEHKSSHAVMKGMGWAGLASVMWGISGTTLQLISQNLAIPATWMLSTRTLITGFILLVLSFIIYGRKTFNVFKSRDTAISVVTYAIFGLMLNLLTFYFAVQTGNASAATILQYLSPLFIVLGNIFIMRQRPFRSDIIAFILALVGVVMCITRGNLTSLALPLVSILWGLGSGITAAFYVVLPRRASAKNPPLVVLGWGTMIAGVLFNLYRPMWVNPPHISTTLVLSVGTVILFGTILPFGLLLHAINFAPSDVVSIMDALQPIVTSVLSVIFFHLHLNWVEITGIVIVLVAIYILQDGRRRKEV
ncbi:DMT family transporter [Limosilactobacillus avium]|uniref:DMT family transporter n=1 Tax=Limosilactobacillus avium TaxID=2991831 RepID=UPI0024BA2C15|nr:DMT family transporter [Limosilactobacillus avium]